MLLSAVAFNATNNLPKDCLLAQSAGGQVTSCLTVNSKMLPLCRTGCAVGAFPFWDVEMINFPVVLSKVPSFVWPQCLAMAPDRFRLITFFLSLAMAGSTIPAMSLATTAATCSAVTASVMRIRQFLSASRPSLTFLVSGPIK